MNPYRTLRYASTQARLRARIGDMPDVYRWREFIQSRNIETAIEQMVAGGLEFWVSGLSRRPDPVEVEQHCARRLVTLLEFVCSLLPAEWRSVADWLGNLPRILQLQWMPSSTKETAGISPDSPGAMLPQSASGFIVKPAVAACDAFLRDMTSPYSQPLERHWLQQFSSLLSSLPRQDKQLLHRLNRLLQRQAREQLRLRESVRSGVQEPGGNSWRLHQELLDRLRLLFAGEPFSAALVLVYGLMELIQFERVRGVLLMQALGWSNRDLSGEAA